MGARTFIVFLLVLAVLGLLGYGLLSKGEEALAVGDDAPDKELSALDGLAAPAASPTTAANGCWSTSGPRGASRAEARRRRCRPSTAATHERFTVLGINLDDNTDDAGAFVDEYGLTYPQLRDGDGRERRDAYGMTGFPESFLVDPEGRIALIRRGPVDEAYLAE